MSVNETTGAAITRSLPGGREVRALIVNRRAPDDRYLQCYVDVQVFTPNGLGGMKGVGFPLAIRSDALRATIEALVQAERELPA